MTASSIINNQESWNLKVSTINSVYIWLLKQEGYDFLLVQSAGNIGVDAFLNGFLCSLNAENCLGSKTVRKSLGTNDDIEAAQKAVYDSIVIVSASMRKNADGVYPLMGTTNFGDKVTIVAPGFDINSTMPGGYLELMGTSQSAPIVTGGLGLLWSLNKDLNSAELKQILVESATDFAINLDAEKVGNTRERYPILNLPEAIKLIKKDD